MLLRIIQSLALRILRIYELILIARAIFSWLPQGAFGTVTGILYAITEPVLAPVRNLLHKISFFQNLPIDFSILAVFLIIDVIRTVILYL